MLSVLTVISSWSRFAWCQTSCVLLIGTRHLCVSLMSVEFIFFVFLKYQFLSRAVAQSVDLIEKLLHAMAFVNPSSVRPASSSALVAALPAVFDVSSSLTDHRVPSEVSPGAAALCAPSVIHAQGDNKTTDNTDPVLCATTSLIPSQQSSSCVPNGDDDARALTSAASSDPWLTFFAAADPNQQLCAACQLPCGSSFLICPHCELPRSVTFQDADRDAIEFCVRHPSRSSSTM